MRRRFASHWAAGLVALVLAQTVGLIGCSTGNSDDIRSHTVTIQVQNGIGVPIEGVQVTAWIVDSDVPGVNRQPIEFGPVTSDGAGQVRFRYEAVQAPYVCGFEVREDGTDGTEVPLAYEAPNVTRVLSDQTGTATALVP